jgi:hypothetical protein
MLINNPSEQSVVFTFFEVPCVVNIYPESLNTYEKNAKIFYVWLCIISVENRPSVGSFLRRFPAMDE